MCAHCEEELQREETATNPPPHSGIHFPDGAGRSLPDSERRFFEPRFGRDLSQVRIHTDERAAASARSLSSLAYTAGRDIVFSTGRFAPETHAGKRLLAHELTHTIQQTEAGCGATPKIQRTIGDGHDLQAPRLAGNVQLEAAFDNDLLIRRGRTGTAVRLIQESLLAQGYTFRGFGADGIFGPETEVVVREFQTDVGATVDGIVGPETMGFLDTHDPSNLAGVGPVAKTGPLPGPRPAPAPGCDAPYHGVTFTLANQTGAGVSPAANIGAARLRGRDFLRMAALAPATYHPDVTINAPSNARAREFEVGLASNLLTERLIYMYSTGVAIRSTLPTPIKDGRSVSSGQYDAIYVRTGAGIRGIFTGSGSTVNLVWDDVPSEG
ncbi:MAG: eCIS core domain-containing protein, partial [bacterium]